MHCTRAGLQAEIPRWYSGWAHATFIAAFCAAGSVLCARQLAAVSPADWAFFVGALVFSNFGEYWIHRGPLHRPGVPRAAYERHMAHHAFFTHETIGVDRMTDLRWVLFPPWAFPAIVLANAPLVLVLHAFAPANLAWLFLLAVLVYYTVYEFFHTLAHLPASWPLGRSRFVRFVTHHHRVHHDPRLMTRWNFNFALPLFDVLFGTRWVRGRAAGAGGMPP